MDTGQRFERIDVTDEAVAGQTVRDEARRAVQQRVVAKYGTDWALPTEYWELCVDLMEEILESKR